MIGRIKDSVGSVSGKIKEFVKKVFKTSKNKLSSKDFNTGTGSNTVTGLSSGSEQVNESVNQQNAKSAFAQYQQPTRVNETDKEMLGSVGPEVPKSGWAVNAGEK